MNFLIVKVNFGKEFWGMYVISLVFLVGLRVRMFFLFSLIFLIGFKMFMRDLRRVDLLVLFGFIMVNSLFFLVFILIFFRIFFCL